MCEAIKLKGQKSWLFEEAPQDSTLSVKMVEKVYVKFFKNNYENKTFIFDKEEDVIYL